MGAGQGSEVTQLKKNLGETQALVRADGTTEKGFFSQWVSICTINVYS